ncbi:uncharacterized protein LOC131208136 [Anopheles bellator]|uniref:uncharacterized protein LOC131208136 n=1 Tax=Anopheles bellator TaxID=139047 RepID=UPI002647FE4F|nr:uncharacterized protein LOC131208136 [Anopheles bellator]
MKIVSAVVLCGAVALLLAAGGPRAVQGEAALGNYYKEVVREQHQAINEMNQNFTELERASEKLIDLGYYVGQHKLPPKTIKITNTVAVKVPVPFPVAVPEPVPVPVPVSKPVPVPVPTLVAVPVADSSSAPPTGSTSGGAPASPSTTAPHADSHGAPSQTVSEVQEYVHSFPIHSVYDAGDDYNPMEGNRLALAEHTASPTERTVSKSSPSSLQQHLEAYRPRRPGQGPPQTGPLSGAGTAQRHHYGVGAGAAGTGGRYHGGVQVQAAPHTAAQFGPEPHALQSSAKSYGRTIGASYKHHTPSFARAPHSPYSAAPFHGRVYAPTAPTSTTSDEGVHGHEPHRGGGHFGGPEYGGGGAAGGEAESYAQFATGSETTAEVPQTAEIRFGGGESEALQAQVEEAGAEGEGPGTSLGADGDSGHYDHHHQQQHAPAAAARPFETVRESYPRYERPDFGHYQHHSVHADARFSGGAGGLARGTGRGAGPGNGGGRGAGAGASGSGSATGSGGIFTEGYDHPALGGKPSFTAGPGGSDGGATVAAASAAAADTHRYPVPGGRTTYPKVSAAGHHHSHPHHPESRPEAHPDLRHQAHDAGAAAAADGLERWPFYQATKDDPHLTRAELKSYHADAASGGPAVRQRFRDSKESEAGYPAYHHHHHILVGHHNTYTEHRPVAAHQPRHHHHHQATGGGHKHPKQYSVPSDAHLYPGLGEYHEHHADHGGGASAGKFHYHFRNVHPYAGSEQHGAGHDAAAASEHHYYQSEPPQYDGAAGPDGAAVLTSYDPPASGSTFHFHPDDDTTGDLLAGASEAHEHTEAAH